MVSCGGRNTRERLRSGRLLLIDRRYGKNWFECALIHSVYYIAFPFVVLLFICFIPVTIFWKEANVDPRSANEINEELNNGKKKEN